MKLYIITFILIQFSMLSIAQNQNLIDNGGFEEGNCDYSENEFVNSASNFKDNLDSVYNHNGVLLELGYSLPQFKENYNPARIPHDTYLYYQFLETKIPGFYSKNNSSYSAGLSYQTRFHNNFYFETGLFYYHSSNKKHRSIDSVEHYYLYPDSIKNSIPYELANEFVSVEYKNNYFIFQISIKYIYKRFSIGMALNSNIYHIMIKKSDYIDRKISKNYYNWVSNNYDDIKIGLEDFEINLSYLIIKEKIPTYIFASLSSYPRFGIKTNLSKININNH